MRCDVYNQGVPRGHRVLPSGGKEEQKKKQRQLQRCTLVLV